MVVRADPSQGRVSLALTFSEATAPVGGTPFAEKMIRLMKPRWGEATREKAKDGITLVWLCIPSLTTRLREELESARARAVA